MEKHWNILELKTPTLRILDTQDISGCSSSLRDRFPGRSLQFPRLGNMHKDTLTSINNLAGLGEPSRILLIPEKNDQTMVIFSLGTYINIWKHHDLNSLFGQKNHGFRWGYNWQEY